MAHIQRNSPLETMQLPLIAIHFASIPFDSAQSNSPNTPLTYARWQACNAKLSIKINTYHIHYPYHIILFLKNLTPWIPSPIEWLFDISFESIFCHYYHLYKVYIFLLRHQHQHRCLCYCCCCNSWVFHPSVWKKCFKFNWYAIKINWTFFNVWRELKKCICLWNMCECDSRNFWENPTIIHCNWNGMEFCAQIYSWEYVHIPMMWIKRKTHPHNTRRALAWNLAPWCRFSFEPFSKLLWNV